MDQEYIKKLNLESLEQKYKELGAEIDRLKLKQHNPFSPLSNGEVHKYE